MTPAYRTAALFIGIIGIVVVLRRERHESVLLGKNGWKASVSALTALISMAALTAAFGDGFLIFVAGLVIGFVVGVTVSKFERK